MQTEQLVSCPKCGTQNFTPRGLKSHRCDGINRNPEADPNAPEESYIQRELKRVASKGWRTAVAQASTPQLQRALEAAKPGTGLHISLKVELEDRLKSGHNNSAAPGGEPTRNSEQPQALQVVAPGTISEDTQIGEQLTSQYHKAVSGMREVLIFGAMLKQVEQNVSALGHVLSKGGHGSKGKGLKGWLATYAPEISRSTAYRFLGITEAVMDQYEMIVGKQIASKFDLPTLVTASPDELPKAARTKQEELFDFVSGTSQRSWLDQFKKEPEKGGKRERPNGTKRRTAAEKDYDDAMAWYEYGFLDLKQTYLNDTLWRTLPDVELANVADLVKLFSKKLDDVCQSRKIVPSKLRTWDKEEDAQ